MVVLAGVSSVGCGRRAEPPSPTGDDVLLFVVDTLRADHLGCYGSARATSPHLDALAARGVRVADATAQSSWTAPSMASLMLSRNVAADFVRMPVDGVTLAERLKAAGYQTIGFQFNVLLEQGSGFERGFDLYLVEPGAEQIRQVLHRTANSGPRFLYFHVVDPHDPYQPLPEFDRFAPEPLAPARLDAFRAYLRELDPHRPAAEIEAQVAASAAEMATQIARYDGEVLQADAVLGTILSVMERQGRLERTLVVVAADHGETLWQHREALGALAGERPADLKQAFKMTHNSLLYQALVHVPLVFAGPRVPPSLVHQGLVANIDIVPTVLELLGLPAASQVDGRSLAPDFEQLRRGERPAGRELVYANTSLFTMARSATGDKVIVPHRASGPDRTLRFQLTTDPHEADALPTDSSGVSRMLGRVETFRREALQAAAGEDVIDADVAARMRELGYLHR